MEGNRFQRIGSSDNATVGREFENIALSFFATEGILLERNFGVQIGAGSKHKLRRFDLGSSSPAVLVNVSPTSGLQELTLPVPKLTVWNEAMFYFPSGSSYFRKILFVLKDHHSKRLVSRLENIIYNYHGHLGPDGVEIWEWNEETKFAERINT